ncbi:MAG: HlyD family efflux transporter periplasmic adaptor subunit [Bacteroidales bacterium]|nr:HlyD family efflux transporter periplasmic adaptor subunit [Bacteroidales bacterium]
MDRPIEKKKITKKHVWIAVGVILVLLVLWSLVFGDKSSKYNVDIEKISINEVSEGYFKNYIPVTGRVEPITTVYLDAMEGGRVEEIVAEEGTMVEKGDLLLKLSNTSLILEISNYEALVSRTSNELRQAQLLMDQQTLNSRSQILGVEYDILQQKRDFENNRILLKGNHISQEEFNISKEQLDLSLKRLELLLENLEKDSIFRSVQVGALEKSVIRMQDNLVLVNEKLENLNFKAPVSGELASLDLEIGQVLNRGQRIGQINILDSYKLRLEIDEYYISKVSRGLSGECDFSGTSYKGSISKIYPEVTAGNFYSDMVFTDTIPPTIRIGQTSRIKLELGAPKTAVLIPRGGFYQSTGGQWVYILDPSEEFATKRSISLGAQNPRFYEILEGLKPGEKVITSSYDNFGNVDKLILKDN